jgi:hypothetical protein
MTFQSWGTGLCLFRRLSKNRKLHQVFLTTTEVQLFRDQRLARARGASLVLPTPTGKRWTESGFRERVWPKSVAAAMANDAAAAGRSSKCPSFTGFGIPRARSWPQLNGSGRCRGKGHSQGRWGVVPTQVPSSLRGRCKRFGLKRPFARARTARGQWTRRTRNSAQRSRRC